MRLTKFGHACVRIAHDSGVLVLDPGGFTEPDAVDGATGVLITHEHADHVSIDHLRATDAPIWTIEAVARLIAESAPDVAERVTVVAPGEEFAVDGVAVTTVGDKHAVIHPDYPRFDNSGFALTVDGVRIFHPGDSLDGEPGPIDLLLTPVSGPWLKMSEGIDFARRVGAARNLAIHDRVSSATGLALADQHFARLLEPTSQEWRRLEDGADLD